MRKYNSFLIVSAVLIAGASFWMLRAAPAAPPPIPVPSATPNVVTAGATTLVRFTVSIPEPTLNPASVNLLRVDASGASSVVARMVDNGQNGDETPGDKVFTARLMVTESQTGKVEFLVSAAFRGILRRSVSPASHIEIWSPFSDSENGIEMKIPPGFSAASRSSSTSGNEIILIDSGPVSPDLAVILAVQVFDVPSTARTLEDVIALRLNPIGISSITNYLGGALVATDGMLPLHFFKFDPNKARAVEIYGASREYFESEQFGKLVTTMRY